MWTDFYAHLYLKNPQAEEFSTDDFGTEVQAFMGDDFDPADVLDWEPVT